MDIRLGDRAVGDGHPCLVVAAIGSNHDGSLDRALALIDAAAGAGADAVRFQSYRASALMARRWPRRGGGWQAAENFPVLERLALPNEWHPILRDRALARGVAFLSTPFDESRATLLAALGVPAFKVASGDVTHLPLLRRVAAYGRPILLSTRRASAEEIDAALQAVAAGAGAPSRRPAVVLLHGETGAGDATVIDLRALQTLRLRHGCLVGWTDERRGEGLAVGAVALGACLVEKPFTDDCGRPGPEHASALEPGAWRAMVTAIRELEAGLGAGNACGRTAREDDAWARRSVYAARPIAPGAIIEPGDLKVVRPGVGLPPSAVTLLVGKRAQRAIAVDEPLQLDDCA